MPQHDQASGNASEPCTLSVKFTDWLKGEPTISLGGCYRHRRLNEGIEVRPRILGSLKRFVLDAHEDARRHLRQVIEPSLDPLQNAVTCNPFEGYLAVLHTDTLKGYLD